MEFINLFGNDFDNACKELRILVEKTYHPDMIVGIATGGAVVLSKMGYENDIKTLVIKKQRPFTRTKEKYKFHSWLPYLPEKINNLLRMIELGFNEYQFNKSTIKNKNSDKVVILSGNIDELYESKKILIVDDSVDSGSTLKSCMEYICTKVPETAEIRTASINVTFKYPEITPTYSLYNRTIVRYPWANDVRRK